MALLTVVAQGFLVIVYVAGAALRNSSGETLYAMAAQTSLICVLAFQWEGRSSVVKANIFPAGGRVA